MRPEEELARSQSFSLGREATTVRLSISEDGAEARLRDLAGGRGGRHFYLTVEGIRVKDHPGQSYAVYLNLPADEEAKGQAPFLVGYLGLFGAQASLREPGGAEASGLRLKFDVSELVGEQIRQGLWNDRNLLLTLVPTEAIPVSSGGPRSASIESERGSAVAIKRVTFSLE